MIYFFDHSAQTVPPKRSADDHEKHCVLYQASEGAKSSECFPAFFILYKQFCVLLYTHVCYSVKKFYL